MWVQNQKYQPCLLFFWVLARAHPAKAPNQSPSISKNASARRVQLQKARRPPPASIFPRNNNSFHIHPSISAPRINDRKISAFSTNSTNFPNPTTFQITSKCLPRPLTRSPSPPRPPLPPRLRRRRRMPARRLPLLARRRSAPRHARRHTPPTSTRVSHFLEHASFQRVFLSIRITVC